MSKPDWENFAKAVLADWPTGDLEGSVLFDLSLQYGMIQEVPGGYNSDRHFDNEGICPEEGDPWYEYTFRGEAGPGLYSIHVLTEQLEAARADAKEAEAYAEGLERDLKTCCMAQVVMDNTVAELERERDEANDVIDKQGALLADAYGAYLDWDEVLKDRADHECKAKLAKAVEALRVLIQHAHNCEKELTEKLHHQDFCGESLPLTNARTTLAEIEGEKG